MNPTQFQLLTDREFSIVAHLVKEYGWNIQNLPYYDMRKLSQEVDMQSSKELRHQAIKRVCKGYNKTND